MIRRNIKLHDGADGWILISQIEHARLAGQLAELWIRHAGRIRRGTARNRPAILATLP